MKGVNLGGWLVLEKWMTPSLFAGTDAQDEFSLCQALLPEAARDRLTAHRDTFVTEADFAWLAAHGIEAVRLPVGHAVFGDASDEPYVGAITYVDFAMDAAQRHGLKVLLDLHGAPGSQNGHDHSGRSGTVGWHKDERNVQATVDVLGWLAERYQAAPSLWGIELLNEPSDKIPHRLLLDFYHRGYQAVRRHCGSEVAVVCSDAFRHLAWQDEFSDGSYENLVMDAHFYQTFGRDDKRLDLPGHLDKTLNGRRGLIAQLQESHPLIVGEWSLALPAETLDNLPDVERDEAVRAYASTQVLAQSDVAAWFFWSYKTESGGVWNFRDCVERGWLRHDLA